MNDIKQKNTIKAIVQDSGSLHFLYHNTLGRIFLKLLVRPFISKAAGAFMDTKLSRFMISRFVRKNHIDLSLYEKREYRSYNDFFTRKIISANRPIDLDPAHFISPCDAKLSAYRLDCSSRFMIKGSVYSIAELLCSEQLAQAYEGGTCLIFRLTVDDYHRYCYLDNGWKEENHFIPGVLHTVQPIALTQYNIYKQNCREYTILHTENFSDVIQVEVGAMFVGRIKNHHQSHLFFRGEEKGMFEFGGSTIVLLLKKDSVFIEPEIFENTEKGLETIVKLGEKIGNRRC